jgi:hypothetical protein
MTVALAMLLACHEAFLETKCYCPKPNSGTEKNEELWEPFKKKYLEHSSRILSFLGRPHHRHLPPMFISGLEQQTGANRNLESVEVDSAPQHYIPTGARGRGVGGPGSPTLLEQFAWKVRNSVGTTRQVSTILPSYKIMASLLRTMLFTDGIGDILNNANPPNVAWGELTADGLGQKHVVDVAVLGMTAVKRYVSLGCS